MTDTLPYEPIRASELPLHLPTAAATSQRVSPGEFQQVAQRGQARLDQMRSQTQDTSALHDPDKFAAMTEHAWQATREPWGGGTYNPRTASAVDFHMPDKHVLTVRNPGEEPLTLEANANRQQFGAAMEHARSAYADRLRARSHYLGVFHDADKGKIEIDPTVVVGDSHHHREEVGRLKAQEISAATHATGGAYHFASGNGVWPPHVDG